MIFLVTKKDQTLRVGLLAKTFQLFVTFTLLVSNTYCQVSDLFISEYVEGSANNKYIEVYNGTGSSVDLSDYELHLFANGSATATTTNVLSGTLANGNVIVYKNSSASVYTGTATSMSAVSFNGDDAIAIYNTSTSGYADILGNIGCDPGSQWSSGSHSTLNKTIYRNASICAGISTAPTTVCTFPTLTTEWSVLNEDDVSGLGSHSNTCCSVTSAPTTNSSTLSTSGEDCNTTTLTWTNGNGANRLVVLSTSSVVSIPTNQTEYTASAAYGSGELLNTNEYCVFNSSGNSVTLTNLLEGTTYFYSIFEYNGTSSNCDESYLTSSPLTGQFTTESWCECPRIRSILVNSCGGSSTEGVDEQVIFSTGASAVNVDDILVSFPTGGNYCNSGCSTKTLGNNAAHLASLNSIASCGADILEYADPIPANSTVILFTGSTPSYSFDFSGICGSGVKYVLYCNNTDGTGRFANAANGTRSVYMRWTGSCNQTVDFYSSTGNTGTDGDHAVFDVNGNVSYKNDGDCVAQPLPTYFDDFIITKKESDNQLVWTCKNEEFISAIEVQKSIDGINYTTIKTFSSNDIQKSMIFEDERIHSKSIYYKLRIENPTNSETSTPKLVRRELGEGILLKDLEDRFEIEFPKSTRLATLELFSANGKLVLSATIDSPIKILDKENLPKGLLIAHLKSNQESKSFKLINP